MSNKDIFSFNPFKKDIDEQLDTPINNAGIMSKDVSSTVGPMGEQMDDSYDPLSFVDRFSKDLVSLFDTEESKEKFKNTYMDDIVPVKKTAKDKVLDEFVVDYNEAFERGRSLQETMNTIETLPLLPIGTEGVLQSPAPVSRRVKSAPASSPRRVKSAPASSPQPVLSAPAPQRRPRGLMEDDYVYTTLPQFRSGMTDPDSYEEGEGESSLFETIRAEVDNFNRDSERIKDIVSDIGGAEVDNFNRDLERIKDTLSYIGEALIPSAAAAEATSAPLESPAPSPRPVRQIAPLSAPAPVPRPSTSQIESAKTSSEVKEAVAEVTPKVASLNPLEYIFSKGYIGLDETNKAHQSTIAGFLNNAVPGFIKKDSHVTRIDKAWCGAFVDHVLQDLGADRLEAADNYDKLRAAKYLSYGQDVGGVEKAKPGDLVIFKLPDGYHISFFTGVDSKGNVLALGGNQTNSVKVSAFSANRVRGVRRIEDVGSMDPEILKEISLDIAAPTNESSR